MLNPFYEQGKHTPHLYRVNSFPSGVPVRQEMLRLIGARTSSERPIDKVDQNHILHSKEMLWNTAYGLPPLKSGKLLILGGGALREFPIELFQWATEIHLVDLDLQAAKHAIGSFEAGIQEKTTIFHEDMTRSAELFAQALPIPGPTQKVRDLRTFTTHAIRALGNVESSPPQLDSDYSIVVSSLVLSQLAFLHDLYATHLARKIAPDVSLAESSDEYKIALGIATHQLMLDHCRMITDCLAPKGRAYVSDTIRENREITAGRSLKFPLYYYEDIEKKLTTNLRLLMAKSWTWKVEKQDVEDVPRTFLVSGMILGKRQ